ncbi:MAG: FAD-dependent oxidoreductase [Spirochaetales bacterium]|nr:FAD-dependent oxidoreductase [Spirochaetales bacterium]
MIQTTDYDCVIIGTGPAGLGTAFHLLKARPGMKILLLDKEPASTGGLRNDCKMNFTYPIGFPLEYWKKEEADEYFKEVKEYLKPEIMPKMNIRTYMNRAEKLGVQLIKIEQAHLGTDKGRILIKKLMEEIKEKGAEVSLKEKALRVNAGGKILETDKREILYHTLIIAPGRSGFRFLQSVMDSLTIQYMDNMIDIGIRIETPLKNYPIVEDYYDPKFIFPENNVRTFCTNSKRAYVVKEKYTTKYGKPYYSVNGHAFSENKKENGLVNFAMLKTVRLTKPLASGQDFAEILGLQAVLLGGGNPIIQRVGDFRLGKRSSSESFTDNDLYNFEPSLKSCSPGDISLSMPARILRAIWRSMKMLDTIIPGILHPSTIMYYPEIKLYANKPSFIDDNFRVKDTIYMIGDGAGTSRGITAAWASGIRAAKGILGSG